MAEVLLVAPADDVHAQVVARYIGERASVAWLDLAAATSGALAIEPGQRVMLNGAVVARAGTVVWWRRTGVPAPLAGADGMEQRLAAEEMRAQLVGGLLSLNVAWVDHPGVVETAEHTLFQLAVAEREGARIPRTVATNDATVGRLRFRDGELVAKAISSGIGIAPFADVVSEDLIDLLPNASTVLQERLNSIADLRVVTIGNETFCWRRPKRAADPVDWRRQDPKGSAFELVEEPEIHRLAPLVASALGLQFCVQDWVQTAEGPVFLEVNPVGQWLFLRNAEQTVGERLASLLLSKVRG